MLAFVDPLIISLTVSILVTIVVQVFSKKQLAGEHIEKCFKGIRS